MPDDLPPSPSTQTLEPTLRAFLGSPEGVRLVENSLVGLAVEKKADDAVRSYLRSRVYPAAAAVAAVLAALGWGIDKQIAAAKVAVDEQARAVNEQRQQVASELLRLKSATDEARQDLRLLGLEIRSSHGLVSKELDAQQRVVAQANRHAEDQIGRAHERLQREHDAVAALREKLSPYEARFAEFQQRFDALRKDLERSHQRLGQLRVESELQGRVLRATVIEHLIMRSHTRSNIIDLPTEFGTYKLQFETPDVDDKFRLTYRIDGREHSLLVSNADKAIWYPLVGTEGRYEFRVDHVFHVKGSKVADFVALRVRTSQVPAPLAASAAATAWSVVSR